MASVGALFDAMLQAVDEAEALLRDATTCRSTHREAADTLARVLCRDARCGLARLRGNLSAHARREPRRSAHERTRLPDCDGPHMCRLDVAAPA